MFCSDLFFEVFDDVNMLEDRAAPNPVVRIYMFHYYALLFRNLEVKILAKYGRVIMVFIRVLHSQNVLIGMDVKMYESRRIIRDYKAGDSGNGDIVPFDYDYIEVNS